MTVGELRKALEGLSDDMPVAIASEQNTWVIDGVNTEIVEGYANLPIVAGFTAEQKRLPRFFTITVG